MTSEIKKPVMLNGEIESFTIKISGKLACCPDCRYCNVFHKPDETNLDLFKCNSCGCEFTAT